MFVIFRFSTEEIGGEMFVVVFVCSCCCCSCSCRYYSAYDALALVIAIMCA